MQRDHRRDYHRAWSQLTPPLRPHPEVVAAVREQIKNLPGRALLLGVTPELADIAPDLMAVDRNLSMVTNIWPGNTDCRRALVGDWRLPNFAPASFSMCIGDGSLGALAFPDETTQVCRTLLDILRPEGKFVCRVFLAPEMQESVAVVRDAALSGAIKNFHAFKFRLGMALIADQARPRVGVDAIFSTFNSLFGDRDELARATGWDREHIDTIDFYKGSTAAFHFPTRDQLLSVVSKIFSRPRLVPSGTYEFAERSPLLVADAP